MTASIIFSPVGSNAPSSMVGAGRSFLVSSNNKAFRPGTFSKSIYGYRMSDGEYLCLNDYLDTASRLPCKCRIVRYDLACTRDSHLPVQSFWCCEDAVDTLFLKLIEDGYNGAEDMKASYAQSSIMNDLHGIHVYIDKVNRLKHGWQIQFVPLDDPKQIPLSGGLDL